MTITTTGRGGPGGASGEPASPVADRLAGVLRTFEGIGDLFAPDALFDVNVPTWRFRVRGGEAFVEWLRGYAPDAYDITVVRSLPTATGVVVEVEGEYDHGAVRLFFRNLYVCDVSDGLVTDVSFWCTGDWDPATRAHYLALASGAHEHPSHDLTEGADLR